MNASPASNESFMGLTALKPQKSFAMAFAVFALALAGCASGLGSNSYERAEVGAMARVDEGVVVGSRAVTIEGSRQGSSLGTVAGAVIGGMVGHQFGGGSDERAIGAAVGAVGGAVAGNAIGKSATEHQGYAYTVRLKSGELVSVVQGGDMLIPNGAPVLIERGERVRVIPQGASAY
jgi:outer membrane lipoprotein SlyB